MLVIGYGLAGRLLPGIVHLDRSRSAGGRLEQPITYWNAEGTLAAIGLVLCARLAADRTRPVAMRIAAAAATAPLGAGVYLTYSRGAIAGAVLGLVSARRPGPDGRPAARISAGAGRGRRGSRHRRRAAGGRGARRSGPAARRRDRARRARRCSPSARGCSRPAAVPGRIAPCRTGAGSGGPAASWLPRSRWDSSPRDWVSARPRQSLPPVPRRDV